MIITCLIGLLFVIMGLILQRFPPRKLNSWYGYRTTRSMSDQATWDMAQQVASKEVLKMGVVLCIMSLLGFLISWFGDRAFIVGLGLVIFSTVMMIVRVERKLREFQVEQKK